MIVSNVESFKEMSDLNHLNGPNGFIVKGFCHHES
jgi:hypothetical protein